MNLDWLYEVFSSTNCRCRLRCVSTKHKIADIHTKAITKADVWNHLTRLSSLHSVQAGSPRRAKAFCIRILLTNMMSSSSAFIGPEDFVYICPTCSSVEEDVRRLRHKMGAIPQSYCVVLFAPSSSRSRLSIVCSICRLAQLWLRRLHCSYHRRARGPLRRSLLSLHL